MGSINTINCSASCRPDCRFVWRGPNMFEIQQFNLKFESVLRNQSGIYVCLVSNIISISMSQSISVIVNCKYEYIQNLQRKPCLEIYLQLDNVLTK